jgi:hypothetical protein
LSTTLSKICLSVGPIFTVLPITLSFFIRFQPVKYRIEALDVFHAMVKGAVSPIQLLVWSTAWSNLGQTWSTLVKLGQTSPNSGKCAPGPVSRLFCCGGAPVGLDWLGQTWSNLLELREMCSGPCLKILLIWWVPVRSDRLGPGCLVLRADTRENLGGKNRVITVAPSLFGISWHKERRTKNK